MKKEKEFNIDEWIVTHNEYESIDEEKHYAN